MIFDLSETKKSAAQVEAEVIMLGINNQLEARVKTHVTIWNTLWENTSASPAEILSSLGAHAVLVLQSGAQSVADLTACAALAGSSLETLLGNSKYLSTALPVTIHEDGTVTVNEEGA